MENSNHDENPHGTEKRKARKPRGPSKGLKSIPGRQRVIEWDNNNCPIGPWVKDYKKHIGEISRAKVSILFSRWEEVPQGILDTLWEDTKREFQIEDSEARKKLVLSACNTRWKDFKTKLVSGWITCTRIVGKNDRLPYEIWCSFITKDIWEEFVKAHETEKFKETSEQARSNQSSNIYPHCMGQKSYAEKVPEWQSKGYLPSHLTSMSTGATSSVSSLPMRTNQWLLARSKFDGKGNLKLANEATERVKAEIDVWRHREKTGEFVPGRLDDVLSRALNKKDSRGRVLAIGGHVGIKAVWGPADRRGMHQRSSVGYEELEEIEERVSQRVRKQTMDEMNAKVDDLMKEKFIEYAQAMGMQVPDHMMKGSKIMSDPDANPKIRSSCNSAGHDPFEDLQGSANCRLAIILNGVRKVVATGFIITCFIASTKDNIKVSVDDYDKEFEDAPIPVHHESIQKLKHTQGAFLEWPKALVDLNDEEENPCDYCPKKKKKAKEVESGPQTSESALNVKRNPLLDMALENVSDQCRHMYEMVENLNGGAYYSIVATKHVFSYDEDQEVQVTYDDVTQLITGAWLNTSVLQVFIMDLYDWLESSAIESIGFMCPQMISETMIKSDPDGASRYMQQAIHRQQHKRFILGPYHERDHWILLVLSPSLRVVYIFDPIKKQRRNLKIKVQLQNAFRNYKFSQGSTTQRVLTWQQVDCAQQTGGRECAYYVMRYMLEIAQENYNSENLCADYVRTAPYSDEEIHEIRERFAEYFIGNIEGY